MNRQSIIVKPEDIKEAIQVLKQDINNETYEDMDNKKAAWADISFMVANEKKNVEYGSFEENNAPDLVKSYFGK